MLISKERLCHLWQWSGYVEGHADYGTFILQGPALHHLKQVFPSAHPGTVRRRTRDTEAPGRRPPDSRLYPHLLILIHRFG